MGSQSVLERRLGKNEGKILPYSRCCCSLRQHLFPFLAQFSPRLQDYKLRFSSDVNDLIPRSVIGSPRKSFSFSSVSGNKGIQKLIIRLIIRYPSYCAYIIW